MAAARVVMMEEIRVESKVVHKVEKITAEAKTVALLAVVVLMVETRVVEKVLEAHKVAEHKALMTMILLPIYTFLILFYRKLIHQFFIDIFPNAGRPKVEAVLVQSNTIVRSYMMGLLLEMVIVTVLNAVGFFIFGIQYAIFLAVFAAVLNLIPYIGMLIASVFCMAVTLTTSDSSSAIIWTGAILIIVQFIDNNFIMPYIVGSKVRINALVSIVGVLVGGLVAGLSGMFLSIPVMAIMKAVFDRVDNLKPWGLLLGEKPAKENRAPKSRKMAAGK